MKRKLPIFLPPPPSLAALDNLRVEDGLLSFANLNEFATTATAISQLPSAAVEDRLVQLGFESMWQDFSRVMDRTSLAREDQTYEALLSSEEKERFSVVDEELFPLNSTPMFAYLLDRNGNFLS